MPEEELKPSYANVFTVTASAYDVTLDFGYRNPEQLTSGSTEFNKTVRIAMSLGHAKAMIPILARIIAKYEADNGSIPAPGFKEKEGET